MALVDLDEKRRVTLGQMADFDFVGLCRKLNTWVQGGPCEDDSFCDVCGQRRLGMVLCTECAQVASKLVLDTAQRIEQAMPTFIREIRIGPLQDIKQYVYTRRTDFNG